MIDSLRIPLIKLQNITKKYIIGKNERLILNDICWELYPGEMIAILGRSGSGKSTLMSIMGLLDLPDTGSYWLNGQNVKCLDDQELSALRNQTIGFVFQNFHLLPRLTAQENVALPLLYRNVEHKLALQSAQAMLKRVDMLELAMQRPGQLSGGEQQRIAIARALIAEPSVIFADEPTGALDDSTSQNILDLFHNLNQEGRTLVFVTHDQQVAAQCQQQWSLIDGRLYPEPTT